MLKFALDTKYRGSLWRFALYAVLVAALCAPMYLPAAVGPVAPNGAPPDQVQMCKALPAVYPPGSLNGCPLANVDWGPQLTTDLVRTQIPAQAWLPFNQLTATSAVVLRSTGQWSTLGAITITPPPSAPGAAPPVSVASVALVWLAPTQNTDGSTLTNLQGFNIYQGASPDTLVKVGTVAAPALSYTTPSLVPGRYYFAVTAVSATGQESARSATLSAVLAPPTLIPGAPSNLTITVTVTAGP